MLALQQRYSSRQYYPLFIDCHVRVVSVTAKAPYLNVSYKPQKISPKSQGTVRQLLHERIRDAYIHPQFITDVIKPLQVEQLFDQEVLIFCLITLCPFSRWRQWHRLHPFVCMRLGGCVC